MPRLSSSNEVVGIACKTETKSTFKETNWQIDGTNFPMQSFVVSHI